MGTVQLEYPRLQDQEVTFKTKRNNTQDRYQLIMSVQKILEKNTVGLTRNSSSSNKLSSFQSENSLWSGDKSDGRGSLTINKYDIKKSFLHSDVAQRALTIQRTR